MTDMFFPKIDKEKNAYFCLYTFFFVPLQPNNYVSLNRLHYGI